MNKYFKISLLVLFTVSNLFISCNTESFEDNSINQKKFELNSKNLLTKSSTLVSPLFLNMGVKSIKVIDHSDFLSYNFETVKLFGMNKENINFSDYTIILKDDLLFIESNPDLKLTILENRPYVITPIYEGFAEDIGFFNQIDFNILWLFMNEMILSLENKIDASTFINDNAYRAGCSFGNTVYVFATGLSRSVAEANLVDEIAYRETAAFNTLNVVGCSAFGGVDTSCLWGNHGCISTQAYCCN